MKKGYIKFLFSMFFLLTIFTLKNNVYAATADGKDTSLTVTINGQTYTYEPNGVTFYVDQTIDFGEEVKLHVHYRAPGLVKKYECWVNEDASNGVNAKFDNFEIDTNYINEADFDIIVNFEKRKNENNYYQLDFDFGDKDSLGNWFDCRIYFYNVSEVSLDIEDTLREQLGTGYNEVCLRDYDVDSLVDMIVERSLSGFTNKDSQTSELRIKDKEFDYSGSVTWQNKEVYNVGELNNLKLKCINSGSGVWKVNEEWEFDYNFYYIPSTNKLIFTYSQCLVKDQNGNDFDSWDGKNSQNNYDNKTTAASEAINALLDKIKGDERGNKPFNDIFDDISYYEPTDETVSSEVTDKASVILTVITNIGMILAVLMLAILGVKYMLGSLEEKAEYKKDMIPYLVGACLLFGISTIVKVLQQIGESINNI